MKLSKVLSYSASLGFLGVVSATPLQTNQGLSARQEPDIFPKRCYPNPCKNIQYDPQHSDSVCGDPRLGPLTLPTRFPVSVETATYYRYGGLCADEFIMRWAGDLDPKKWFNYPDFDGFALDSQGKPIMSEATITKGRKLDRFGSPKGKFVAPLGSSYISRALPPPNLAPGKSGNYPDNYHVYEVMKPFAGFLGPVASWFGQPGFGSQIYLKVSVQELLDGGFLRELKEEEFDEPSEYSYDPSNQRGKA
ncbi:hypothetical protein H112_07264 [Trichophyton rubrum D6]|uniref:TNT domain-containing protein n=3 Tax=Trichophyton TaxID=5550 RepID=F2SI47_TRIRC|nr:uncharacterized protein TERG_02588 [Trichophyton rubrum CBS 118892]EZF11738.1 hypothetical protein H100_07290 [Trichophyton rubrum MR850]EZF38624.1 hypothetical protein H102_07251 [Trichophyton rubrum CBS 100081]EZF49150.1 hypothetical protein H103_07273 [Trichophyton rubrum CBS 288.86]EZF59795.1 hypothetical protein H104_07226 [Trichophyton rubrum CBS 289.86]EZF70477.1 hypothetical protein H105_07288 [Trichophyton soudanense CBS 452.61]EZF81083.1 hypothetical protein H110_07272 [Trichophy